jgi:DNA invertase Pin-like site-specific DNA recombinase
LEQEFNSLHAQREACEAFIKSQRHVGWSALPQAYDDGGRSGGNMERPALQQLLGDIREGKVDVVVVYKIDRLTRSLADFAKIVEIFDARGVSFVSVTQQFNTTTSMGRLTLNVLLSFAQFEREVTGERIRDKIAASKRKGMWMGGVPPLGYAAKDRKLVVIETEAEKVRHIFRRYAALGSVRLLKEELEAQAVTGKCWTGASGRNWGGQPLGRGALYWMLQNRIYRGEIILKDEAYPGEHAPIIDPALWDKIQSRLAANTVERGTGTRVKNPSLLVGLLFGSEGHRMTPTHAIKNGRRYRYYVSRPLIVESRSNAAGLRIPAAEIEQIVANRVRQLLSEPASVFAIIEAQVTEPRLQRILIVRAKELGQAWDRMSPLRMRAVLLALLQRVEVATDQVIVHLRPRRLAALLDDNLASPGSVTREDEPTLSLSHPIHLRRAGKEVRMVIDRADPFALPAKPDPSLIKAIGRAHHYYALLVKHGPGKFADLAKSEGLNRSYYSRLLRLAYLAPDITTAILDGRQPEGLTATTLSSIPTCRSAGPISDPCSALSEAASVIRQAAARRPRRLWRRGRSASDRIPLVHQCPTEILAIYQLQRRPFWSLSPTERHKATRKPPGAAPVSPPPHTIIKFNYINP